MDKIANPRLKYINSNAVNFSQRSFKNFIKLASLTNILLVIILSIIVGLISFINPLRLINFIQKFDVLGNITQQVTIPLNEIPVFAIIGDKSTLDDISAIKALSQVNAGIYKDAKNGDYVLAYSNNQMVIYRLAEDKIIYYGLTADKTLEQSQKRIVDELVSVAKSNQLITSTSTEVPQIRSITNVDLIKQENPSFYKNIEVGDLEARFPIAKTIFIYRTSTSELINSANFDFSLRAK